VLLMRASGLLQDHTPASLLFMLRLRKAKL